MPLIYDLVELSVMVQGRVGIFKCMSIFIKSSGPKVLDQIWWNVARMSLGWSSTKVAQIVPVHWINRSRGPNRGSVNTNFENLLLRKNKAKSFHIWYVAWSRGPLSRLFKLSPFGQNWGQNRGHRFILNYIGKSFKNLLVL